MTGTSYFERRSPTHNKPPVRYGDARLNERPSTRFDRCKQRPETYTKALTALSELRLKDDAQLSPESCEQFIARLCSLADSATSTPTRTWVVDNEEPRWFTSALKQLMKSSSMAAVTSAIMEPGDAPLSIMSANPRMAAGFPAFTMRG